MTNSSTSTLKVIQRFFEPVMENKVLFLKAFVWFFWRVVGPIFSLLFLEKITMFLESWDKQSFYLYLGLFVWFVVVYYFVRIIVTRNWSWVALTTKWNAILYDRYIKKFLRLDWTAVEKIWTWRMISICTKWFDNWTRSLTSLFNEWTACITYLLFATYSIRSLVGFWYMVLFLVLFAVVQIIMYFMNKNVLESRTKTNEIQNENSRTLVKIIMSKFEILQSKKEKKEIDRLRQQMNQCYVLTKERSLGIELMFALPEILIYWIRIALFFVIWLWIFAKTSSFSDLVLFTGILWLMDIAMTNASALFKDISKDFVAVQQLRNTFDSIPTITTYDHWEDFFFKKWDIHLENISFGYERAPLFSDFSLSIVWWTKTAFVGESWWGKTTLLKLIAWYIQPDNWEIKIDKQSLSKIKLIDYYRHIGYLTQEPSVFDGTIYENLVYALDSEPPKESIDTVIKLAKCEFVREFENWLETEIGEKWVRLSWWQKQRLAIAKIMLKNPSIILLDEPTSALDSFNEELISIALHNLFKWKTVIVVAHRLQTVQWADRILLFEKGKVLEDWTHQELINQNWKYKKMLDLQSWF